MTHIRQTLIDIQETQCFERLEPFKHSAVWSTLAQDERVLLARLLVMQGAQQLAQGSQQVLESFESAAKISSFDPQILYSQGAILASYRENFRCLMLASQAFSHALKQNSDYFDAWYGHALVLMELGRAEGEVAFLLQADKNFEKAETLYDTLEANLPAGELFWQWGRCLASLGQLSGEPLDFHRANGKYALACDLGCQHPDFFIDYGKCYVDLGELLERQDYLGEALKLFNQAIREDQHHFEGWYNQACCLQRILDYKYHDPIVELAERSFVRAVEIQLDHPGLWHKWGRLEATVGKAKRDHQKVAASLEKYARANELEANHPQILSSWAETELYLGAQNEQLELIHSAQSRIIRSLEVQPEDPDAWYIYGSCLNELGNYFLDEDYYFQAIEKFQYGLSLARRHPLLWYGLAISNFALGELLNEKDLFEKSVRSCARVIECGGGGFPQFWNDWGVALLKLADMTNEGSHAELAIEKFEKAIKLSENDIVIENVDLEWVYNYGCAFDLLGDFTEDPQHFEKAVQILTQVLQLDPNYRQARYNLALALSHLGEAIYDVEPYHKAIEHFEYLLDADPEDEVIHLDFGMALTNLGLLVEDIHHPERSQTLFRQAENHLVQAAALGNMLSHYQLAGLYSLTENYEHAMHHLERARFIGVLPGIDDLLHDDWLEGLRRTPAFRQFINELSSRQSMDDK